MCVPSKMTFPILSFLLPSSLLNVKILYEYMVTIQGYYSEYENPSFHSTTYTHVEYSFFNNHIECVTQIDQQQEQYYFFLVNWYTHVQFIRTNIKHPFLNNFMPLKKPFSLSLNSCEERKERGWRGKKLNKCEIYKCS